MKAKIRTQTIDIKKHLTNLIDVLFEHMSRYAGDKPDLDTISNLADEITLYRALKTDNVKIAYVTINPCKQCKPKSKSKSVKSNG